MAAAAPGRSARLAALRAAEAVLLARRTRPADMAASVAEALRLAHGAPVPADLVAAGQRIAAAVAAHGASFAPGAEPAYHDRHHQAEATLCAGWLARAAREAGQLSARRAALCVIAMAGHDLLHDGSVDGPSGLLEARSAAATLALAHDLPAAEREEIRALILVTDAAQPAPVATAPVLMREADLFGSLTPCLGWRLSRALAREWQAANHAEASKIACFAGRLELLRRLPGFSAAAVAQGLAEARAVQIEALARAGDAPTPEASAALLDAMSAEAAQARYCAALTALGLPVLPA